MNSFQNSEGILSSNSRVLLCVLKPFKPLETYSNSALMGLFEPFGRVVGLRIFERNVKLKALVEFECRESLESALRKLHKVSVEKVGIVELYISKKTSVSINHSKVEMSEFSNFEKPGFFQDFFGKVNPDSLEVVESMQEIDLLHISRPSKTASFVEIPNYESLVCAPSYPKNFSSSKVLMLNRLNFSKVNLQMIANLLGCFANITKVIINQQNQYALAETQLAIQADSAIRHLSGIKFFDKPVKIKLSNYSSLSFKNLDPLTNAKLRSLEISKIQHRFSSNFKDAVIPPSEIICISNVSVSVSPKILFDLISIVHEPTKLKSLPSQSHHHHSFLLKFQTISHACDILSIFHGKIVEDDVLFASFTTMTF